MSSLFLDPIRYNLDSLKNSGYDIQILYDIEEMSLSCDFLILFSKAWIKLTNEKSPIFDKNGPALTDLIKTKNFANKVIWFDTADGSAMTHFEVLPFVDLYLKSILFKDRDLYRKNLYGGRLYTNYYHENYNIKDSDELVPAHPLDSLFHAKVKLSWNIGMGDIYNLPNIFRRKFFSKFPEYFPTKYNFPFTSASTEKGIDIFMKMTTNLSRETIVFHREKLFGKINKISKLINAKLYNVKASRNYFDFINGNFSSFKRYVNDMKSAKIVIGPFSYGDINGRDYESIIHGALLIKPEISYLETWPALLIPKETFVSFDWDFNDLTGEKLLFLMNDNKKRIDIVNRAQERYMSYINDAGMEKFCERFITTLES